ncbi:hypothetical protein IWX49DRAFT_566087 [Phyllosticta citricarpa]|uniref:Secreted protein n=1 Tax=Phyllosticta citricarpa TaxID=55181 RepID=A0ABR1MDP2_9PEZI
MKLFGIVLYSTICASVKTVCERVRNEMVENFVECRVRSDCCQGTGGGLDGMRGHAVNQGLRGIVVLAGIESVSDFVFRDGKIARSRAPSVRFSCLGRSVKAMSFTARPILCFGACLP